MSRFDQELWICNVQENIKAFGGGTSSSTQKTDPWPGQQSYLSNLSGNLDAQTLNGVVSGGPASTNIPSVFNAAAGLYSNPSTWAQYFGAPGTATAGQSTVAPMNAQENSAISDIGNTGLNGTPSFNAAETATANTLSGDPAMNQTIAAGVLPQLESQFTQGNAGNSPAMGYAASQGLYSALLNNRNQAANTANTLYGSRLSGQNAALTAGQTSQTQAQNELTNLVNMWNYQQNLPAMELNQYGNLVSGGYGGTTVSSAPNQSLLGSLFSDRRLKKDIRKVGERNGLGIYLFKYLWSDTDHVGYMSDEVKEKFPEAIGNIFGFDTVDYGRVA